jgi:hypothetical protein
LTLPAVLFSLITANQRQAVYRCEIGSAASANPISQAGAKLLWTTFCPFFTFLYFFGAISFAGPHFLLFVFDN